MHVRPAFARVRFTFPARPAWGMLVAALVMALVAALAAHGEAAGRSAGLSSTTELRVLTSDVGPSLRDREAYRSWEGTPTPLEAVLLADAEDGRWDDHSLLEAALIAGGTADRREIERYRARIAELAAELRRQGLGAATPRDAVRRIFEFLHRRVLNHGYRIDATHPGVSLEQGYYNCVSATTLFLCTASELGFDACAVETPAHVMIRVRLPDGVCDVESTCPEWFQLTKDPKKRDEFVRRAMQGNRATSFGEAASREISPVELVAMVYYNRGVDLLARRHFAEALAANAKSLRLAPGNATARGNLLAVMNNWAIAMGVEGRFAEATRLLRQGLSLAPDYAAFHANLLHVYRRRLETALADDRWAEADATVAAARRTLERPQLWHDVETELVSRRVRQLLDAGRAGDADRVRRLGQP